MTPLRRFASSPLKGGRTLWPGEAGSTGALGWGRRDAALIQELRRIHSRRNISCNATPFAA
jgi:hypothetical protein